MIRTGLAVTAGLLCALAGLRQSGRIKAACARLRRWETLLRQLALVLSESALSLPEALQAAADGSGEPDALLRRLAGMLRDEPLRSAGELWERLSPAGSEAAILLRMTSRLSRGSLESRCLAVTQAAEEIALLAAAARDRSEADARMWRTLGLTCGLCLTLMLV